MKKTIPMDIPKKPFRVVIVGSSVSGLTLGHCLHKAGIDFIILEKHHNITIEVGATIVIGANGALTLDQLGLQEALEEKSSSIDENDFRFGKSAKLMGSINYHLQVVQKRTGYGLGATTRAELLTILFTHFPAKDKILTDHCVKNVELFPHGVSVYCENGAIFNGDIVVGADGIHSTIRGEMWRHANAVAPKAFSVKDKSIAAEFKLLFGISKAIPALPKTRDQRIANKNFCFLIVRCSGGRIGWFFFKKMDKKVYAPNIPRFTQKDAEEMVQPYLDYSITDRVLFREVWENRIVSGLVPIEEYLAERWTWDRIVCVGDAIRKTSPTSGQGGNTAIEDVAELSNALNRLVGNGNGSYQKPDTASIKNCLEKFQKTRYPRAKVADEQSRVILRTDTLDTPLNAFVAKYILPNFPDIMVNLLADLAVGAASLNYLPLGGLAKRGNMYRANADSITARALRASPLLLICLWFFYFSTQFSKILADNRATSPQSYEPEAHGLLASPWGYKFPPNSLMYWLPLPGVLLAKLETAVEFYASTLTDELARSRAFAQWFDFNAILGVWMVESRRRGNILSFAQIFWVFVWIVMFQGTGFGVPLYCFFHYLQNPITNYRAPDLRHIPVGHAQTLLPALLLGFTLPTAYLLLYAPSTTASSFVSFITAWQFFPITIPIIQTLLPYILPRSKLCFVERPEADLPYLRGVYAVCALASTLTYWYTFTSSSLLSSIYPGQLLSLSLSPSSFPTLASLCAAHLNLDILAQRLPMLYLIALNFRDLKAVGRLTTSWAPLVLAFVGVALVLGPGTALVVAWACREELLASWRVVDSDGWFVRFTSTLSDVYDFLCMCTTFSNR